MGVCYITWTNSHPNGSNYPVNVASSTFAVTANGGVMTPIGFKLELFAWGASATDESFQLGFQLKISVNCQN